tara:strand:+ start:2947 stop:3990 length:1044 start_codon:yes stop_codon:yes gene_type:complete
MASKSVYQEYEADALNYFGLSNDPYYGVVVKSEIIDVLVTQDQTTYEKIETILSTPNCTETDFKTKKKAWVMPGCSVAMDRLKPALKEHGIIVTNDYEIADLIVGEEYPLGKGLENGELIPSTALLCKLWNYETTSGPGSKCNGGTISKLLVNSGRKDIIIDLKMIQSIRSYDLEIEDALYDHWMLTGMAINLAHRIDVGQFEIVSPEIVLNSSSSQLNLTYDLLEQIKSMMKSGQEDKAVAISIIPNIDYNSNHHLLWQLAHDCDQISYADSRNKNLKYWLNMSRFEKFERISAQDMILWLEKKELLNRNSFRHLEPIVRREIHISNRDLYVFNVAVKKEYQQYLK